MQLNHRRVVLVALALLALDTIEGTWQGSAYSGMLKGRRRP